MKSLLLSGCLILAFVSCTNNDNNLSTVLTRNTMDSTQVFADSRGTSLTITNSTWFTTTTDSKSFGQINLAISGSTNADRVTVLTRGDGLIGEQNILLNTDKSFKKDTVTISFAHFSGTVPTTDMETSTVIKAYRGLDTLSITLQSGKLKY